VLASAAAALAIAVCPPAGPAAPVADPGTPPADALIACVGKSPVSGALLSHWTAISQKGSGDDAPAGDVREQALLFLINGRWIEGEAAERGIKLPDRAVRRRLTRQKHAAFPDERAFRQFLEDSGMTRSDLKYRVRLDMLSERIRTDAAGTGSARTQERRISRFLRGFGRKWKARTSCLPGYVVESCGATLATETPPAAV
jgi:hypothetical protein